MHEPVDYDSVLYFIIGAIILCGSLFFVSPKLMNILDEWVDQKSRKKQEAKKATDKSEE